MNQPGTSFLVQQLLYQTPLMLVYLIGAILGLAYLGKYPAPALLTLLACGLAILTGLGLTAAQAYLVGQGPQNLGNFPWLMGMLGLGGSLVRALSLGLLLTAVFIGRRPPVPAGPFKDPKPF